MYLTLLRIKFLSELIKSCLISEPVTCIQCPNSGGTFPALFAYCFVLYVVYCVAQRPVKPIKLTKNLEIPSDVLASRGLTRRQVEQQENSYAAVQLPQRTKDETADEKRARKQAVRDARKVRLMRK